MKAFAYLSFIGFFCVANHFGFAGTEQHTPKPIAGFFVIPLLENNPGSGSETLELDQGRFTYEWGTDAKSEDFNYWTGLEDSIQTGRFDFDGYRLVLLGDRSLFIRTYYFISIEGVDFLLDSKAAEAFTALGKIDRGGFLIRLPNRQADIAKYSKETFQQHPGINKIIQTRP